MIIYIFEYDDALVLFNPQLHAYALGEQIFLYTFYYAILKLEIRLLSNAVFSVDASTRLICEWRDDYVQ